VQYNGRANSFENELAQVKEKRGGNKHNIRGIKRHENK